MRYLLPLLLLGCSDYSLRKDDSEGSGDVPVLQADPEAAALQGHCGEDDTTVTLSNEGAGTLTILDLQLSGEGWSLASVSLPLSLSAGESVALTLTGSTGSAELIVTSDDPIQPELSIPLDAQADAPPSLSIESPAGDTVIDEGGSIELVALVSDAEDPVDGLTVRWSSDLDGALGDTLAGSDGLASQPWSGGSGGSHVLTASVTDSCGQTATASVGVCQQAISTTASVDLDSWNYEGNALWDSTNDWVQLTGPSSYAVGSAFDVTTDTRGTEVSIEFQFYNGDGTGADGFALTALDLDRATGYLGSAGGCLGYGYGSGCEPLLSALPGWTIEFDTYENNKWDPTTEDHIAFMFDGDVNNIEAWAPLPDIEDSTWHTVVIEVSDPTVVVYMDGIEYLNVDLAGYFDFPAHVGFSAATGGLTNYHLIDALTVTDLACPIQ